MKNTPVRPLPGHHHLIDKLSVLNGVVTGLALYPQIYLILVSHVENTLSPMTGAPAGSALTFTLHVMNVGEVTPEISPTFKYMRTTSPRTSGLDPGNRDLAIAAA